MIGYDDHSNDDLRNRVDPIRNNLQLRPWIRAGGESGWVSGWKGWKDARMEGWKDGRKEGRKEGRKKERKEREGVRQNIKNPLPISLTPSREAEASDPCTMPNAFYSACCNNALLRRESS
jgi:hypothetical protein